MTKRLDLTWLRWGRRSSSPGSRLRILSRRRSSSQNRAQTRRHGSSTTTPCPPGGETIRNSRHHCNVSDREKNHCNATSVITGLEPPATLKSFASWAFVSALARPDSMPPFLIMIPSGNWSLKRAWKLENSCFVPNNETNRFETLNLTVLNRKAAKEVVEFHSLCLQSRRFLKPGFSLCYSIHKQIMCYFWKMTYPTKNLPIKFKLRFQNHLISCKKSP